MAHTTAKALLKEAADQLPDGASLDDAMERLLFLSKVEEGKADVEAGRTIPHAEMKRRLGL